MQNSELSSSCFHCGLPVPDDARFEVVINEKTRPMCCPGCEAVAKAIVDSGNSRFYDMREDKQATAIPLIPEFLQQTAVYDHPDIQKSFVNHNGEVSEASLILEGISCAACIWLNEQHIAQLPGVLSVNINYSNHRATVRWDNDSIKLSEILQAIAAIGYQAHPYSPERQQEVFEAERRTQLKRLGIAGLFGMQVMMIAIALYAGDFSGMELEYESFLNKVSWLLATPIVFYSAVPLFRSAWRDLSQFSVGMDVPVALGITIAYSASIYAIIKGEGYVYFDSVAMFVFLLLGSRYFELIARKKGVEAAEKLMQMQPATATRIVDSEHQVIPVVELNQNDTIMVKAGETLPADGYIVEGGSSVDESLLTGEFDPVTKVVGDKVIAGSVNVESPLIVCVSNVGTETIMAGILRLLDNAQNDKPPITLLADRAARYFVFGVLIIAAAVAMYWSNAAPDFWLPITLSVLVVSCPCALSLATPAAISAASTHLLQIGLLVTRGRAIEALAAADLFAFDKTGTLTKGKPVVDRVENLSSENETQLLQLAAALERYSEHPIAKAIQQNVSMGKIDLTEVVNIPGQGVHAVWQGNQVAIGSRKFIKDLFALDVDDQGANGTEVLLADKSRLLARFTLRDVVRSGAQALLNDLTDKQVDIALLTGDNAASAQKIADELKISKLFTEMSPEDKLKQLQAFQQQGRRVVMVGDGINDAPVLAGADVSIAMGNASELLHLGSDMVLLNENLQSLNRGVKISTKTLKIIRQNITWAIGYNLVALPLAVSGNLSPWMAALGMSLSSLLVVANALRLSPQKTHKLG